MRDFQVTFKDKTGATIATRWCPAFSFGAAKAWARNHRSAILGAAWFAVEEIH